MANVDDALAREVRDLWDRKAGFWDDYFCEGNDFQRLLVGPATERLLAPRPGQTILDIACGNGAFSRRLAELGVEVVACDFSRTFIERARARTTDPRVSYHVVDVTREDELLALGEGRFDAAVCTMALMDIPAIAPLASALARLLKPRGRFVFSVQHPCFNSLGATMMAENQEEDGNATFIPSMKVTRYLDIPPERGAGIIGEPNPHYYFHRPLHELFGPFFGAGFAITGLEEPAFAGDEARPLWWGSYHQIPPVLVTRMVLMV